MNLNISHGICTVPCTSFGKKTRWYIHLCTAIECKAKRYTFQIPLCKVQPMANDDAHQCFVIFLLWKIQKFRKWYASLVAVWWQFPLNCHPRSFNESDTKVTLLGWQFQWKWHQSDTLGVAVWCHFSIFIVNTNKTRGGSFIESDTLGVAV